MDSIEKKLKDSVSITLMQCVWFLVRGIIITLMALYMQHETGSTVLAWFISWVWIYNEYRAATVNLMVRKNTVLIEHINEISEHAQEMRKSYDDISIRFRNIAAETQALRNGVALGVLHNKLCGVVSPEILSHTYNASGVAEIMKEAAAAVAAHERDMIREAERIVKQNGGVQ